MFKILDWYIIKKFITTFVFAILLLTFISVVIDISEKADDFVRSGLSTRDIIMKYYLGFVPFIVSLLFPLFVFIAVVFFTSKMAGRSEIVAILASGITFNRFIRPYFFTAIFLAILLWLNFRYVLPPANKLRTDFQLIYVDKQIGLADAVSTFYFRNDSTHYGQIGYFDPVNKTGNSFVLQEIKDNRLLKNLRAEQISWDTLKNNWKLQNLVIRTIDSSGKETIIKQDSMRMRLNFIPSEIKKTQYTKDILNTPELDAYIAREKIRGAEEIKDLIVEKHKRNATPFSLIILTLIGVSMSSRKVRGGSGFHIAIAIVIAASYILLDQFSTIFSTKGDFPPVLAAWTPNILFTVIAVYSFLRAPK